MKRAPEIARELGFVLASRERLEAELRKPALTSSWDFNPRTAKPERGGLFCCRVFGPIDDHACICGKYKGTTYAGIICEKCGVEVISSSVRGERFGRIDLPVPVLHPWLAREASAKLGIPEDAIAKPLSLEDRLPGSFGAWIAEKAPELAIEVVPVTPPDWRPVRGKGGANRRYAELVDQSVRLREFLEHGGAPAIVILAEEAKLFAAVARVMDSIQRRIEAGEDAPQLFLAAGFVPYSNL